MNEETVQVTVVFESEEIVQSSTTTIPHTVDPATVHVQLRSIGGGSTQSSGIQRSSQHHTSELLQVPSDISKEGDVRSSSKEGSKYSSIKMHEASEARTVSVKKFEEVKPVQQDKEHSDVLFASSVQTKIHSYFRNEFECSFSK